MGILSIIGMVMSLAATVAGILLAKGSLMSFLDPASAMVVFIPTIGSLLTCFPLDVLTRIPAHFKVLLGKSIDPAQYVERIVLLARKSRQEGLLALESEQLDIPIAEYALRMIVDGVHESDIKEKLEGSLSSISSRHDEAINFYEKAGAFAPAFGMVGTVVGLINMLKAMNFEDVSALNTLGGNMALALITTFYGAFLANVVFLPIAARLKFLHKREVFALTLILNGLLAIQRGDNQNSIQEYLVEQLNRKDKKITLGDRGGTSE